MFVKLLTLLKFYRYEAYFTFNMFLEVIIKGSNTTIKNNRQPDIRDQRHLVSGTAILDLWPLRTVTGASQFFRFVFQPMCTLINTWLIMEIPAPDS